MTQNNSRTAGHRAAVSEASHHLVLLHFLGGSAREWDGVIARLPAGIVPHAIDLPGFGGSDADGYTVESMADHIEAQIRVRVGEAVFSLIGHSMSAKVCMVLARRSADGDPALAQLQSLVLVAGSPPAPEPMTGDKRATMLSWFDDRDHDRHGHAEGYIAENIGRDLPDATRTIAIDDVLRARPGAWAAWLESGSREDWSSRIGRLDVPTLVVVGSADAGLGADAQRTHTMPHLSAGRLEEIVGAGHLLPLEAPDLLAALIVAHVKRDSVMIPSPYRALIDSDRVGAATRQVLLARGEADDLDAKFSTLPTTLEPTLRALIERVIPQPGPHRIDLSVRIDRMLGEPLGDGWRFDALPADLEAWTAGLLTLDHAAAGRDGFSGLTGDQQDALLTRAAAGELTAGPAPLLDAAQMKFWFEDVRSAAARLYMAHPATLARIGYSGIANGGDGARLTPRVALGEGERESWEPMPEIAR